MFGLFSKKKNKNTTVDFASIKTDMHSHLLPGIDDGSPDIETSIQLVKGLKDLGYNKLITTPHIFWDMYKNTPEIINEKLQVLNQALKENDIDIEISAAAEYFLDEHTAELIRKKEPLLTISGNMVLVEFSVMHMSIKMKETIFDLMMAGYQPVLAHPERYIYLAKNLEVFDELKENGCMFQLNLLSMAGGYGREVYDMGRHFLNHDFYNLVGTDVHHSSHIERLKSFSPPQELNDLLISGQLLNPRL